VSEWLWQQPQLSVGPSVAKFSLRLKTPQIIRRHIRLTIGVK